MGIGCRVYAWRFIQNVDNLVCPAVYDLGQAKNLVALSVTEGPDKPIKYPVMFRKADLLLHRPTCRASASTRSPTRWRA